jgi:hypothetical protein
VGNVLGGNEAGIAMGEVERLIEPYYPKPGQGRRRPKELE